jgi:signal transduction histidine kinase/DNA-binding response OmpR family regulator
MTKKPPIAVLIVEDDPHQTKLVEIYLSKASNAEFDVFTAARLHSAVDILSKQKIDVILLDLHLLDSRGFETFAEVYATANPIPIIVLTGTDDEALALKAVRAGAQDYLIKDEVNSSLLPRAIRYAIERKREQETLKQRNKELAVLNAIARSVNRSLEREKVLTKALDQVLSLDLFSEAPRCGSIFLKNPETGLLENVVHTGVAEELPCVKTPLKIGECLCGKAAEHGEIMTSESPPAAQITMLSRDASSPHREICIPLKAFGEVLGVMNLWLPPDADRHHASKRTLNLLQAIGEQVVVAVKNAELYETARRRMTELGTLNRTSQAIASVLNIEELFDLIISEVKAMLKTQGVSVLLYNPGSDKLVFAAVSGPEAEKIEGLEIPATQGIAGWVLQHWQATLVNDVQSDPRHYQQVDRIVSLTTESLIAVPLKTRGKIIGVIEAVNRSGKPFTKHELALVKTLAGAAAVAIENARLYEAEREQRKLIEQSRAHLMQNQRLATTGQMAASLAHEINNPLQAIHNSMEMILSFPLEPEEQQTYIEMADEEIRRLIKMVNRILDFSRRPQEEMQTLDINRITQKVLQLTNKYLQHRHVSVQTSFAPDLPPVKGNATTLGQVFLNLLINAVEAMPEGGLVNLSTLNSQNRHVDVKISDTGKGIPPDVLGHIFEPFFSTKGEGTGLGLSISHSIVQQHNGDILVDSRPGEGATFTVRLPTAVSDSASAA